MRKFLQNFSFFVFFTLVIITILIITTAFLTRETFDFNIPLHKNILVVGNSRPECAINDSLLPNFFNLAQGGSGYFYDYLKVREVTERNTQIDTVVVGYSYGDLANNMDLWFSGKEKIKYKLRNHFFLFTKKDYLSLLRANPTDVLANTPQTIFHNLKMKGKGYAYLGGFRSLKENKLEEAIQLLNQESPNTIMGYSQYQKKYLLKLYEYCKSRNIKLILINVPMHPMLEKIQEPLKKNYQLFAEEYMPEALLINHSNYKLTADDYRDLSHLNHKGAKRYSNFLKTTKFHDGLPLSKQIVN